MVERRTEENRGAIQNPMERIRELEQRNRDLQAEVSELRIRVDAQQQRQNEYIWNLPRAQQFQEMQYNIGRVTRFIEDRGLRHELWNWIVDDTRVPLDPNLCPACGHGDIRFEADPAYSEEAQEAEWPDEDEQE